MYELKGLIQGYKERKKNLEFDINQVRMTLNQKLQDKENLDKFIEILEREENECQQ